MDITILGSGCANCRALEAAAREAAADLGIDASFDHVTDPGQIASWGVMKTPALVIDDEVVVSGRVPTTAAVRELLASHR
jgi:small redox-active disulfide protein 2